MSHSLGAILLPRCQLEAALPGNREGAHFMEEPVLRPAAVGAATPRTDTGPLTPSARLIVSLLPDTRCRTPDQDRKKFTRIFMNLLGSRSNS